MECAGTLLLFCYKYDCETSSSSDGPRRLLLLLYYRAAALHCTALRATIPLFLLTARCGLLPFLPVAGGRLSMTAHPRVITLSDRLACANSCVVRGAVRACFMHEEEVNDKTNVYSQLNVPKTAPDVKLSSALPTTAFMPPFGPHVAPCAFRPPNMQLTDFGIARSLSSGLKLTSQIGTAQFMPPEALSGACVCVRACLRALLYFVVYSTV